MSKTYREPINALDLALQLLEQIEVSHKGADGRWQWMPINYFNQFNPDYFREWINEWAKDERIKRFRIIIGDEVGE